MKVISDKRFLVRSLFTGERFSQLMLVDLTEECLKIVPFERETAATVFIDKRVILIVEKHYTPSLEQILVRLVSENTNDFKQLHECLAVSEITPSESVIPISLD